MERQFVKRETFCALCLSDHRCACFTHGAYSHIPICHLDLLRTRLACHLSAPMTRVSELNSNWLLEEADLPQEWRLGGRCLKEDVYL